MPQETLTFDQGIAIGLIAMNQMKEQAEQMMRDISAGRRPFHVNVSSLGKEVSQHMAETFTGKPIPLFPHGVPSEALEPIDRIVLLLLMEQHI